MALVTATSVLVSRLTVPALGLLVWFLCYLNARFAYQPRSARKLAAQLSCLAGSVCIFVAQVQLMERLTPNDAYGVYFFGFIMVECVGGLIVLFSTLIRERTRSRQRLQAVSIGNQVE